MRRSVPAAALAMILALQGVRAQLPAAPRPLRPAALAGRRAAAPLRPAVRAARARPLSAPILPAPAAGMAPAPLPRAAARRPVADLPGRLAAAAAASLEGMTERDVASLPAAELGRRARLPWEGRLSGPSETPAPEPAAGGDKAYLRKSIVQARFGNEERQKLLAQAYGLRERINSTIVGQDPAARVLQDKLVQYLEGLGTRAKEPVALHMIGLPGIGKSVMVDHVQSLGINLLRIDAQRYTNPRHSLAEDLRSALEDYFEKEENKGKPFLIVLEELDKLPEMNAEGSLLGPESSNSLIGTLNQLLTDGKLLSPYSYEPPLDLSNVFFLTTMNLAPAEIERFSKEVIGMEKSYYDFTVDDFARFDEWLRLESASRYKILSRLFRSNTVSRLAPNSMILRPLGRDDYRSLARLIIDGTIRRATAGPSAARRLEVSYSRAYLDWVAELTSFAPSGARENVFRADALTEQLVNFGARATAPGDRSLDRPRALAIDFDPARRAAAITVTPRKRSGRRWMEGAPFRLEVSYDPNVSSWIEPAGLALQPPPARKSRAKPAKDRPLSKKHILDMRFPRTQNAAKGLAQKIDRDLIGQEDYTRLVEREMNAYLGRPGPAVKEPPSLVFAGFPGIGKTELVRQAARHLDLPIIRVNMQAFSSDDPSVVQDFMDTVLAAIASAKREKNWKGKYVVLLEELDKVFELELDGSPKNRPIMALVKDLMNDGQAQITTKGDFGTSTRSLDLRDAFLFLTMNFSIDRFGFKADPRQTSIDDVLDAWRRLTSRLADMKSIMGSMFLPETVSRLMSRLHIMSPLDADEYRRVINLQVSAVIRERLHDASGKNRGLISLKLTPAYRRYLFSETVVPSEGPRHTAVLSRTKLSADLEAALKGLKKSSDYAAKPITITLDYKPGRSQVVGSVKADGSGGRGSEVFRQEVPLFFPPLRARGLMEPDRVKTAVHEFGHALVGARLGLRFEYATVVQPEQGVGGYVKFNDKSATAKAHMAAVYAGLGSRAMERLFLSPHPLEPASVMDVTSGPSMDIKTVTLQLYNMLYELGFDPAGGTMDRLGAIGMNRYADFESLPAELVERLGLVLRDMEDHLVADLQAAHPREWYVEKITALARAGGMDEREFYELTGYPYPGAKPVNIGEVSRLQELFRGAIKPLPAEALAAQAAAQGADGRSAPENVSAYARRFLEIIASRLRTPRP